MYNVHCTTCATAITATGMKPYASSSVNNKMNHEFMDSVHCLNSGEINLFNHATVKNMISCQRLLRFQNHERRP